MDDNKFCVFFLFLRQYAILGRDRQKLRTDNDTLKSPSRVIFWWKQEIFFAKFNLFNSII